MHSQNSWPAEKGLSGQTLQPVSRPAFWSRIQAQLHCKCIYLPHEWPKKMEMCPANFQLSFLLCADTSAKSHLSYKISVELISVRKCGLKATGSSSWLCIFLFRVSSNLRERSVWMLTGQGLQALISQPKILQKSGWKASSVIYSGQGKGVIVSSSTALLPPWMDAIHRPLVIKQNDTHPPGQPLSHANQHCIFYCLGNYSLGS